MSTEIKSYFLKLNPPRASFTSDMSDEERAVESEAQLNKMIKDDPANGLNSYEIYPMRAVTKQQ